MKSTLTTAIASATALLLFPVGCQQADRAITAQPSHTELFSLEASEPKLPISVGVEGRQETRPIILVRPMEKFEPTPEEKAILGIKDPPEIDKLVLYRSPRGPDQGISADAFALDSAIGDGHGGSIVGLDFVYPRYMVDGFAGGSYSITHMPRERCQAGIAREPAGRVGRSWRISIGETGNRRPARAQQRHYR